VDFRGEIPVTKRATAILIDRTVRWGGTMATSSMDITSFVGKLLEQDDVDALREGVRVLAQAVMETEVSSQIGAAPYERSSERLAYRNGYRTRRWDTRVGTIELKIPKVSSGAYFPSLLERGGERRRRCTQWSSRPT
jgi:transposase-like protein